jgi:hypothetical protein
MEWMRRGEIRSPVLLAGHIGVSPLFFFSKLLVFLVVFDVFVENVRYDTKGKQYFDSLLLFYVDVCVFCVRCFVSGVCP